MMPSTLAIALGDVTGIGPEVTLKALALDWPEDDTRYVLVGDAARVRHWNETLGLRLPISAQASIRGGTRLVVHQPGRDALPAALAPGDPEAAAAAITWVREGARLCLAGEVGGLVTAPLSKEAVIRSGLTGFVGQTELLTELAGPCRTVMMLLGPDERDRWLRVALATTHVPIKDLPSRLTREGIELAIDLAVRACRDLGLPRARVGVCGFNPHAGEGGQLGDEELTLVGPAVQAARLRKLEVAGPLAADTLFHQALHGAYDAVVAMYHDQGLAPLKLVAFDQGVNWTLGLPFVRTSPDHGTAYDIAGRGTANPASMRAAIRLARQLARSGAAQHAVS
jgi:4-hydroxythreonine-4-phosphate dehydrogenase